MPADPNAAEGRGSLGCWVSGPGHHPIPRSGQWGQQRLAAETPSSAALNSPGRAGPHRPGPGGQLSAPGQSQEGPRGAGGG